MGGIIGENDLLEQYSKYKGANREKGKNLSGFQAKISEV